MLGERVWRRFPGLKSKLMGAYYALNARKQQDAKMSDPARARLDDYFAESIAELRTQLPNVPQGWGRK